MKKAIFVVIVTTLIFSLQAVNAQRSVCDKTIYNCNANLVNQQFADNEIGLLTNISYAKPNAVNIAPDVDYISHNPEVFNCNKSGSSLIYDIYYPGLTSFVQCALPAIFMIHPGAYSDSSDKDQPGMEVYCRELAKRGFVVFNVEYRRGTDLDPNLNKTSASYVLALYRSFQDLRGAVRSAIQMQRNNVFTQFKFDENFIFLGGAGTTPMNVAYYTQPMMDELLPDASRVLGPLNADFYYGGTAVDFAVKGVLNLWGSVLTPLDVQSFAHYFTSRKETLAPLISFHGVKDPYSNYIEKDIYYSNAPYNSENACLLNSNMTFTLDNSNGNKADLTTYGSQSIYDYFNSTLKRPCELYLDCAMDHGLDNTSGFGTGTTDVTAVQIYIVQRAATFFQAVVNGIATNLNDTRFVDCQNYRQGCSSGDNNNNCKNSDECGRSKALKEDTQTKSNLFTMKYSGNQVQIFLITPGDALIELYNANGIMVKHIKTNQQNTTVNTAQLIHGVYVIKVVQKGLMQSKTVAIQ